MVHHQPLGDVRQQRAGLGAHAVLAAAARQAHASVVGQIRGIERVAPLLAQPYQQPAVMVTIELRDGIGGQQIGRRQGAPLGSM
ncbi:hypothetical protein G6F52_014049 [Rhizopus delemar]|nr:hypothetical protein G6F52_014049 [Rhizopus delemar]